MGDRLVQTFQSACIFLQVPLGWNYTLATLLQKRKLCTKHREYNDLSLLLLERYIAFIMVQQIDSFVWNKTGSKLRIELGSRE